MNPLLVEPTDEQLCLMDVIYRGRELGGNPAFQRLPDDMPSGAAYALGKRGIWPIFQYVERVLFQEHGLDARRIFAECPMFARLGGPRYGWLCYLKPTAESLALDDEIGLTIAGMARLERAKDEVSMFLDVLAIMVDREQAFVPSPTELQTVELEFAELAARLDAAGKRWMLGAAQFETLADLMAKEPSTWHCTFAGTSGTERRVHLSPFIRRYQGVTNGDEYVDRLVQSIAPTPPAAAPLHPSSLSLPEAIDYLNAVWRAYAGTPLMRIARAEAAAKLALDCATADEFETRLSALAGILAQLEIPGANGHKLVDLKAYLETKLEADGAVRAREAVDDLRAFIDLRVWRQHPGADERARKGAQRLGVELATGDWEGTWRYLQARATAALATLREEIESVV